MATHKLSILGDGLKPDNSGAVYQQPYTVEDSAAVIDPLVWILEDSGTKIGLSGKFKIPENYVGTAKITVLWNANATSGAAVFDLSYLARTTGEDMGAAATDTTDTVTTTTNGTAFNLNESSMTLTSADFAAGDTVPFEVFRDGANASDTLAVSAIIWDIVFEYADA